MFGVHTNHIGHQPANPSEAHEQRTWHRKSGRDSQAVFQESLSATEKMNSEEFLKVFKEPHFPETHFQNYFC